MRIGIGIGIGFCIGFGFGFGQGHGHVRSIRNHIEASNAIGGWH